MTPAFKINHILNVFQKGWADELRVGWLSNPADQEVLDYFKKHAPQMARKFCMMTLVDLGKNPNVTQLFDEFSHDDRFGIALLATKGRPQDLADIGTTAEEIIPAISRSIAKLKAAMPDRPVEFGIEHAFSSFMEGNEQFLEKNIVAALLAGATKIVMADTDGAMTPQQIKTVINKLSVQLMTNKELKKHHIEFSPSMFAVHTHNDLGLGAANSMAAVEAGVREVDIAQNSYGERAGNTNLLQMAAVVNHSGAYRCCVSQDDMPAVAAYSHELHRKLGSKLGDRTFAGKNMFNAVGGMHANQLLKAYRRLHKETGISIQEFISTAAYTGSYNSVPAPELGGQIDVTLSPVAGRANVQFMLEVMGVQGIESSDPRITTVLETVKQDEMAEGINYRGRNNANSELLLASTFGLRDDGHGHTNAFRLLAHSGSKLRMKVQGKTIDILRNIQPYDTPHISTDNLLMINASDILGAVSVPFREVMPEFAAMKVHEVRHCALEVGKARPHNAGSHDLTAVGERVLESVSVRMKEGEKDWTAHGTGKTLEDALLSAMEKVIDYKIFKLEQERRKAGQPILLDEEQLKRAALIQLHRRLPRAHGLHIK